MQTLALCTQKVVFLELLFALYVRGNLNVEISKVLFGEFSFFDSEVEQKAMSFSRTRTDFARQ